MLLALCLVLVVDAPKALDPQLKITLFADAPQIVTPTGIAVDGKGRVLCIESHTHFRPPGYQGPPADRIRRFEDTDGDGKADKIETVYEGSKHTMALAFGPGGGLFVATRNEVFRLDMDADGKAAGDRTTLVRLDTPGNYPHNGLSGVTFDFDGTLYFGLGENLGADYTLIGSDGTTLKGGGEGGNIYRCKPDGAKLERVATGFWNPFAMTFDAFGRLFAVDNDPDSRPPCRLLQIVEGGDYGYRFRNGRKGLHPFTSWNGELPGTLPMMAGTGEAPSGIVAYESDQFPSFRGDLLVTSWGDHRIDKFRIVDDSKNATLKASVATVVRGGDDFRPVGIVVAPDGSLFVSDWVSQSYELHGKGRIWHITAANPPARADVKLGAKHRDRMIRDDTARALAARGEAGRAELRQLLEARDVGPREQISALHSLIASGDPSEATRVAAGKLSDPRVVAEMLRFIPADYLRRIDHGALLFPSVRAAYLRRGWPIADSGSPPQSDPFFAQAARRSGLPDLDIADRVKQFRESSKQPRDRLDALLSLRDESDPSARAVLRQALIDEDPDVRFVAIQWVGEQKLVDYRADLIAALGSGSLTNRLFEGTLAAIDLLDGNRAGGNDDQGAEPVVARLVADPKTPAAVRRRALRILRPDHPAITAPLIDEFMRSDDLPLHVEAVRTLRDSKLPDRAARLLKIASDQAAPPLVRAEAIAGLSGQADEERRLLLDLVATGDPMIRDQAVRSLRGVTLPPDDLRTWQALAAKSPVIDMILKPPPPATGSMLSWYHRNLKLEEAQFMGDPASGELIFHHPKGAGCATCHRVAGRGGRVGPDLTATGPATSRWRIFESIVFPSQEIAPQYTQWRVARHDGTTVQGVLVEEAVNGDQTYADAEGHTHIVRGSDLAERTPLKTSVMPDGLALKMSLGEFRDVVAYLRDEVPANTLSEREKAEGWTLLFDGQTMNGWTTDKKTPSKNQVFRGTINPHNAGGYMMIHEKEWGDFVLSLDFMIAPRCNTGVFIRTSPLEPWPGKDVGFNGIEIAIDDTKEAGYHDTGAIYDLVKPRRNAMNPAGDWNHLEITCDGPKIVVVLNGETVSTMDLDQWTAKNKRPDGTEHKFDIAYKDHPRRGFIGLQDHGSDCWYKNIKIRPLRS